MFLFVLAVCTHVRTFTHDRLKKFNIPSMTEVLKCLYHAVDLCLLHHSVEGLPGLQNHYRHCC